MWDGSTVPLKENLDIAEELLDKSQKAHTVLEIEIGAVGGEEDGHSAEINEKLDVYKRQLLGLLDWLRLLYRLGQLPQV